MEQSYYRIGEVSRATGLSKDTLHFYDKIGLLSPDHVDPQNGYRYYSLRNLWQLDIITACRKLNIPLDTVRQILSLQDNAEIVRLLMEYREEALRRSAYYQQVAEDILWYKEEHRRIEAQKDDPPLVRQVWREAEQVIAGRAAQGGSQAYHVNMQQAAQAELQQAASIRRRYGYPLDGAGMPAGRVVKLREYVRMEAPTAASTPAPSTPSPPGGTPSLPCASGRSGPTFLPCWTGWPPTGRRPTPSTPRNWGCSSFPTWTTTPARCGPI